MGTTIPLLATSIEFNAEPNVGLTTLIETLVISFAAFWLWLTVRIINRRERWARRVAFVLVLVAAYPISVGPTCWLWTRGLLPDGAWVYQLYTPIFFAGAKAHGPVNEALWRYVRLGAADTPVLEVMYYKSLFRWRFDAEARNFIDSL